MHKIKSFVLASAVLLVRYLICTKLNPPSLLYFKKNIILDYASEIFCISTVPSLLLVISKPSSLFLPHFSTSSATPVQVYILMKEKLFFEVTTLSPWRIGGVKKLLKRFSSKIFWTGEKNWHITLLTPWPWPPEGEGYVKKILTIKIFFSKWSYVARKFDRLFFWHHDPPDQGGQKYWRKRWQRGQSTRGRVSSMLNTWPRQSKLTRPTVAPPRAPSDQWSSSWARLIENIFFLKYSDS